MTNEKLKIDGLLTLSGAVLPMQGLIQRSRLHDEYGGNRQSGIAPCALYDAVFAFSGPTGGELGYHDEWQEDGFFKYYGAGQVGDMQIQGENARLDQHQKHGDRLFLFDMETEQSGFVYYRGEFERVEAYWDRGPDKSGNDRKRVFWLLRPLDSSSSGVPSPPQAEEDSQLLFDEGWERETRFNRRERSRKAIREAKRIHGTTCQVCGFDFNAVYGSHGLGFIEAHHLLPLAEAAAAGKKKVNPKTEMCVVCSNCHRMLHRGKEVLSVDRLKAILEDAAAVASDSIGE